MKFNPLPLCQHTFFSIRAIWPNFLEDNDSYLIYVMTRNDELIDEYDMKKLCQAN